MEKVILEKPEIKLVGISVRTSYTQELDTMKGNILPVVMKYFHEKLFEQIPHRIKPNVTFCAYTDYESDYRGGYTYFIGEEVSTFDSRMPDGFKRLTIPEQQYARFTTPPAPMPEVVVNAWKEIWEMSPQQLGGTRGYRTDFEVYDERAADHQKIILDVYIGIRPSHNLQPS